MSQALGLAVLAGILSSGMFLAMLSGVPSLMLLAYFVQLPLLFAGFTLGLAASVIAVVTALMVTGVIAGLIAAVIYLLVQAAPALVVVRQALLSREQDGQIEWYPPGLLLAQLAALAALAIVVAFVLSLSHPGGLQGAIEQFLTEALQELETVGSAPLPAQQIEGMLFMFPSLMASSWLVMIVVNSVLAQALAVRIGWNRRPTPPFASLELPWWLWPPIGLAAACAVLGGSGLGFLGSSVLVVLLAPYAFLGLAVIHKFADRWTNHRGLALGVIYAGIVILGWPVLAVLALGLVEDWAQLRRYL